MSIALDELPQRREILLSSGNQAVAILGEAVASLHTQFRNGEISSDEHAAGCSSILAAVGMLNGTLDVDAAVMESLGLNEMASQRHGLTDQEHLALLRDIRVQLDPERGIAATQFRSSQGTRSADRGRGNLRNMTATNAGGHPSPLTAVRVARTGRSYDNIRQLYRSIDQISDLIAPLRPGEQEREM